MDDIELQDAGEEMERQAAAPAPDASDMAKAMIAELRNELGQQIQPMTAAQQRRESQTEKYIADLLQRGASKEGVEVVLNLMKTYEADREAERREYAMKAAEQEFHGTLFAQAEQALEVFKDTIPGFRRVAPGLVQAMSDSVRDDKEFRDALQRIQSGAAPTKAQWEKIANKAVNEWLDEAGLRRRSAPVDMKSGKPKADYRDDFDSDVLDGEFKKLYLAVKNATGDEKKARAAVENTRRAKRG